MPILSPTTSTSEDHHITHPERIFELHSRAQRQLTRHTFPLGCRCWNLYEKLTLQYVFLAATLPPLKRVTCVAEIALEHSSKVIMI